MYYCYLILMNKEKSRVSLTTFTSHFPSTENTMLRSLKRKTLGDVINSLVVRSRPLTPSTMRDSTGSKADKVVS